MGRSMTYQGLYLKKETTPGTANTTGMQRYLGIGGRPGWNVETQEFRAEGYKTNTTSQPLMETGQHTINTLQDYNALLPVLASVLTYDGATQPDAENAATAYEHTFHLNPTAMDTLTTFTGIWGDATQAIQMLYLVFNSLSFGIQRGSLSVGTSAISKEPTTGASLPTSPTTIPSQPIPARSYSVYIDDAWADLGDTKATAVYDWNLNIGDKLTTDAPIDAAVASFAGLIDNEGVAYDGNFQLGFDASAVSMIGDYKAGTQKFARVHSVGPTIGGDVTYELEVDASLLVVRPGEITSAPNAPVVVVPFDYILVPDATSGNELTVRLVNEVATI